MTKLRLPKIKFPKARKRLRKLGSALGKKRNRPFIAVGGVLFIVVFATLIYAGSVYRGGWNVLANFDYVVATGTRYATQQTYTKTVNAPGESEIYIATSGGEQAVGPGGHLVPAGSPDVDLTISAPRHSIIDSTTGALKQTTDYTAHVDQYQVAYTDSNGNPSVWYGELHYYAFEITTRTNAKVVNYAGTLGVGDCHEGNTAGSYGMPVSVQAYISFQVNPWNIVTGTMDNTSYTFSNGTKAYPVYQSGFAGILSASVWSVNGKGVVPGVSGDPWNAASNPPQANSGGYVKNTQSGGDQLTMWNGTNGVPQINWKTPYPSGLPSTVDIQVKSGDMLADAHKDLMPVYWWNLQPRDVYDQYTIVVQVLQAKNYVLRTGYQQPQGTPLDWLSAVQSFLGQLFSALGGSFGQIFGAIIFIVLFVAGIYITVKLLPPALKYLGRKIEGKGRRR